MFEGCFEKEKKTVEFPAHPVVRTPSSQCRGTGSIPGWERSCMPCGQKKKGKGEEKEKKEKGKEHQFLKKIPLNAM